MCHSMLWHITRRIPHARASGAVYSVLAKHAPKGKAGRKRKGEEITCARTSFDRTRSRNPNVLAARLAKHGATARDSQSKLIISSCTLVALAPTTCCGGPAGTPARCRRVAENPGTLWDTLAC